MFLPFIFCLLFYLKYVIGKKQVWSAAAFQTEWDVGSEETGALTASCVTLPICGFPYNTISFPHYTIPLHPYCGVSHATPDPMIRHAKPSASPFVGFSPQSAAPCHGSSGGAKDTKDFATNPSHHSIKAATPCFLSPISSNKEESIENHQGLHCQVELEDNDSVQTRSHWCPVLWDGHCQKSSLSEPSSSWIPDWPVPPCNPPSLYSPLKGTPGTVCVTT